MRPFFKLLYRIYRLMSGLGYRGQRRFTRAGLVMLGALALAGIMGPDTENNVAYQGFTVLFFLVSISVVFSAWFRGRFSAVRVLPQFGTVGSPLTYTVELTNRSSRVQSDLVLMEDLADRRPSFEDWLAARQADEKHIRSLRLSPNRKNYSHKPATLKPATVPSIPPGGALPVRVELTPLRRGVLRFTGLSLGRADPMGLCRAFVNLPLAQSMLILPKRYPLPPIALPGSLKYQEGGVALAANVGQSEEFVALRDYRHGDPLRHIHWRSWAKTNKPVVKEFEDEFFVRHALVLDTFTEHPRSEACEEAISVAASFACTLLTQESLLDLLFVGPESYVFTAGRGLAHADQMLEILASVQPCREKPFVELEHLVLNHASAVTGCICVFLSWNAERQSLVEKLQVLGVPLRVLVVLERDQNGKLNPGPLTSDPQHFHVLAAGRIEQGLAELE